MLQQAIHVMSAGAGKKDFTKICRAMMYLEKSKDAPFINTKAVADLESEPLMGDVGIKMTSDWHYVNTEDFLGRWMHHYCRKEKDEIKEHLWVVSALTER